MNYPKHLLKLIESLKKFPGVGTKSAERFAFELLKWPVNDVKNLAVLIDETKLKLKTCKECGCLQGEEACHFCTSDRLEPRKLCILASPKDAYAIESTREFKGHYHVLGGVISPLDGVGPESLHLETLLERIQKLAIEEIVIAIDSTVEGDATSLYLKKYLGHLSIPITRLAFGIPMGSSIDFVDEGTLARALAGRFSY